MQFPIFQMPYLGNGLTIALDAVLHVLISHGVAIGVLSLVVLSEYLGYRKRSAQWEEFAHGLMRFSLVIITAVGAITGVGIWFVTSALEPRGIGSLLRIFFWPWFIEWFAFVSEMIAILTYYFLWDRWQGAAKLRHIRLGTAFLGFGILSAVLITGILGFMLTPDTWPQAGSFFAAFFNSTFLPQLLLRLSAAFTIGAVLALAYLLFTRRDPAFRLEAMRLLGGIALVTVPLAALFAYWYFSAVPSMFKAYALFSILTSAFSEYTSLFWIVNGVAAAILVLLALLAVRGVPRVARILVIPVILLLVGFVGEFERMREFIRGPYVMPGYMFANQVMLSERTYLEEHGLLANSYWYNATALQDDVAEQGLYLFGQNCSVCHSIGGMNSITVRVAGRTEDGIYAMLGHTSEMVPFMSPFSGTEPERRVLAQYLYQLSTGKIDHGVSSRFTAVQ